MKVVKRKVRLGTAGKEGRLLNISFPQLNLERDLVKPLILGFRVPIPNSVPAWVKAMWMVGCQAQYGCVCVWVWVCV